MFESILTISITAFIAGIIFAMPIAGPVSIVIASNALNGRKQYSYQVAKGATVSDFLYIFIAIYGITKLYTWYKPLIPYLLLLGALFLMLIAVKILKTPVNLMQYEEPRQISGKVIDKERGGFYTGFMINILNPTLFITVLISSFFVISLIASFGFSTGGLEQTLNNNVQEIGTIEGPDFDEKLESEVFNNLNGNRQPEAENVEYSRNFQILISVCYAFFIAVGGLVWFYFLTWILSKYRRLMNVKLLSSLIKLFGFCLVVLSFYFGYLGVRQFL